MAIHLDEFGGPNESYYRIYSHHFSKKLRVVHTSWLDDQGYHEHLFAVEPTTKFKLR